ncbi:MAG: 4-aminobutyrate aminotransferase-like enzyme [Paracoccaceae bacterium]|jgi:4-aminobutyrate aminotransferase-like enzyme
MIYALRIAQAVTCEIGIIATDNTYHGNTLATNQFSTRCPPIGGYPDHVRLIPAPDVATPVDGTLEGQAQAFADHVDLAIAEPGGARILWTDAVPGYLDTIEQVGRGDEVQPGFGRLGSHWWGHQYMGLTPDVVTPGKPMANGHPVAAVLTRPDIMSTFRSAFGYFNTFGGNVVSCSAASAVLDVIEEKGLMPKSFILSGYICEQLAALQHPLLISTRWNLPRSQAPRRTLLPV